jgi:hypothetical protein
MEPLLCAAYAALFLHLIRRSGFYRDPEIPSVWMQVAFLAKVAAGIALGWIYYHHYRDRYTSDTIKFFDDSGILFETLRTRPWDFFRMLTGIGGDAPELRPYYERMSAWLNTDVLFNDNKTIIRLNTVFRFFSCGYYYVHVVLINILSFTGIYAMYRTMADFSAGRKRLLFVAVFFLPSLLFWGSGLLKDGLMLFALGFLVRSYSSWMNGNRSVKNLSVLGGSLFLLLFTKFYVIMTVLPGLLAWRLAGNTSGYRTLAIFTLTYASLMILGFNLYRIWPNYDLSELIYWKQHNFLAQADRLLPASRIQIPVLDHGIASILLHAPGALVRSLIHPAITDHPDQPLVLATAIENMLLLGFLGITWFRCRANNPTTWKSIHFFSLFMCLIILTLIGLITPVLGALVRYKIVVYPFLLFVWIQLMDAEKSKRFLPPLRDRNA